MERKPEELGKLFEVILNQSGKYLQTILPLETKLKTIFDASQSTIEQQVNRQDLIEALIALEPTNEPAKFLKLCEDTRTSIEKQIKEVEDELVNVIHERTILLDNRLQAIKMMISLIPLKYEQLLKRYKLINIMLIDGGAISSILKQLDDITNSRISKIKRKRKQRAIFFIQIFGQNTLSLLEYLMNAYTAENEFVLNEAIAWFDRTLKIIQTCIEMISKSGIDVYLEEQVIIDEKVDEYDIATLYEKINELGLKLEDSISMISSKEKVDKLIVLLKKDIITISERQRLLQFREGEMVKEIKIYEHRLDEKQFILKHFWKFAMLRLEDFPADVTDLLNVLERVTWEDARKKYAVIYKTNLVFSNVQSVFKSLVEAYNRAMTNLRQAKRNYKRYDDQSSKIGLEKCLLHPVEINRKATWTLNSFNKLCRLLDDVDVYIKDTDLFYDKNMQQVEELYRELNIGLRTWSQIFIDMFHRV